MGCTVEAVSRCDEKKISGETMEDYTVFPNTPIRNSGAISDQFLKLNIKSLHEACRFVHDLPYGYNSDRDDLMVLFKENRGTCTTKHAVIGTLAAELNLPVEKTIGIYAMTEEIVTGTNRILEKYGLPYLPMVHCFLVYQGYRVDLTEGNRNGKNRSIEDFLHTQKVEPNISGKNEYLIFRNALRDSILTRSELNGVDMKRILHAREEGLALLKSNLNP
jgi:hypothetical protein